ncbi:CsbD family protein [Thioalkalivibrio sp. ALR17-21]|uniref:CsbD family protein n=1 Tax=Thioalkalivibrio sp. ALR17-21 TaxID=1269813 RepID=UPI00040FF3CD|nr:CsbD family protein [Thioalkalivibrio sp. ALR17-21]
MNKNQIKGRTDAAKGKVQEIAGDITGDKKTEQEGKMKKYGGKAEAAYGDLKSDINKATD